MAKRKKTRGPRRKSIEFMEHKLAQLSRLRMHHNTKIKTLDMKIAAQEELIAMAKEDDSEK